MFELTAFTGGKNHLANLTETVDWIGVTRDDREFLDFLKDVLNVLELPGPPDGASSCEWCRYRVKSRETQI
jgi:hypothetical protein